MCVDFSSMDQIIEHANDVSGATAKAADAWTKVRKALQGTKTSANADVELATSVLTLQVANTQAANAQLIMEATALRQKLTKLRDQQADFKRYELWETPAGRLVYRLKETEAKGEPMHYLCPDCKDKARKSILQGSDAIKKCYPCDQPFRFKETPERPSTRFVKFM